MKKTIVLITSSFPWGNEAFLETEINYYRDCNVLIFPVKVEKNSNYYEILNPDISIFKGKDKNKIIKAIGGALYLFKKDCFHELITLIRSGNLSLVKLKKLMTVSYFSHITYKRIRRNLENRKLNNKNLVFYGYWMDVPAYTAILLKRRYKGSKAISRGHRCDLYEETQKQNYLPFRTLLNELNVIYPISNNGKRYMEKKYPFIDSSRIHVQRLGVCNRADGKPSKTDACFHILTCSGLIPVKRVERVIHALKLIEKERICWTHIGDGPEYERLRKLAKEELGNHITCQFAGYMENKEVIRRYNQNYFDLFINVSESEGIPVSIMEACSFRIPVIATDVGGNNEIVRDGINGYLLDKDFENVQLKERILKFYYMDKEEYEKYRENAFKTWMKYYNADTNYTKFVNELQRL